MKIVRPDADFSGLDLLADAPSTGGMLGIWDLTGGDEAVARKALYGGLTLSMSGAPTFERQGARVDADNYLGTTVNGPIETLTLYGVFFREPTSMYLGNFDNDAPSDALLETSTGISRVRFWNDEVEPDGEAYNLDPELQPCPVGAPFYFGASFTPTVQSIYIGWGGLFLAKSVTVDRDFSATAGFRCGRGPGTGFTNSPFLTAALGIGNVAKTRLEHAVICAWWQHRLAGAGVDF